ncbi:MAG: DUF58 domain-containing protein [Pirellulaceae bacterium]|nr:DUF58 domain-containing protein [Pirellulaceae bacterium]
MSSRPTSSSLLFSELLSPALMGKLERMELVSRKVFKGRMKGEKRSKRKGQSVEFADFRNYVPGDDLRFIDWNLYARLDKLFLKLFMEEEDLHFYCLLDASDSMDFGEPNKLLYAKQLAAALGYIGLCRSDRVKIEALSSSAGSVAPTLRGRHSLPKMLGYLRSIEAGENVSLLSGTKSFSLRNSGKGIVVLISDLMDKEGYQNALRYLMAQKMDVYVIQVLSSEEIDPDVKGDLKLVDVEDGGFAEISASQALLKRYQKMLSTFIAEAKSFCGKRNIVYLMANTETPVDELVTHYLARRGLVR